MAAPVLSRATPSKLAVVVCAVATAIHVKKMARTLDPILKPPDARFIYDSAVGVGLRNTGRNACATPRRRLGYCLTDMFTPGWLLWPAELTTMGAGPAGSPGGTVAVI